MLHLSWNGIIYPVLSYWTFCRNCLQSPQQASHLRPPPYWMLAMLLTMVCFWLKRCGQANNGDWSPSSPTVVGGLGKTLHHDTAFVSFFGDWNQNYLLEGQSIDKQWHWGCDVVLWIIMPSKRIPSSLTQVKCSCHYVTVKLKCYLSITVQLLKRIASMWLHRRPSVDCWLHAWRMLHVCKNYWLRLYVRLWWNPP